jgi:2-polyprenyl-3-methyl-5-hydroxy-6-metoxy-1,4-benzoquinol methylase
MSATLDPISSGRQAVTGLIDEVAKTNPVHAKKLERFLMVLGDDYFEFAGPFIHRIETYLAARGHTLEFAVKCYLNMIADVTMEHVRFLRSGRYTSTSFAEVNERVYGNPKVMSYYMHGLLLSQVLWAHHYKMLRFFHSGLEKRASGIKHYMEVGGGHGMFLADALGMVKGGETFTMVDISPASLEMAQEFVPHDPRSSFKLADVFAYEHGEKMDFITMGEVMEHVEDPVALLARLRTFLKDDGRVFITTPTNAPAIDHIFLFTSAEHIRQVIQAAGFDIEEELGIWSEELPPEQLEKNKVTLLYGAFLKPRLS